MVSRAMVFSSQGYRSHSKTHKKKMVNGAMVFSFKRYRPLSKTHKKVVNPCNSILIKKLPVPFQNFESGIVNHPNCFHNLEGWIADSHKFSLNNKKNYFYELILD